MKYNIKHSIRIRIIVVVFLLLLSLTMLYVLSLPGLPSGNIPITSTPFKKVPGMLILKAGETTPVGEGDVTIRLLQSQTMPPNCYDCMEQAKAEVIKGSETQMIEFRFGGFAGFHDDTAQAFGYQFIVRELKENSVTIEYMKSDVIKPST